jgi:hypothetical protein
MGSLLRVAVFALGLVALAPQLGCGGKYDTPEACFRTMQVAAHNEDWPAVCDCLTTDSQAEVAEMLVMAGTVMKLRGESTSVSDTLDKHGVTDEAIQKQGIAILYDKEALRGLAKLVEDKAAFVADMISAMRTAHTAAQFSAQFEDQIAGELSEVTVTGDLATAVLVGERGKTPVEFRKTPEGWKRHVNLSAMGLGVAPAA